MSDNAGQILDELLALRCRRGDPDAWRQLVARFEKRLLYYIRRFIDNDRDALDVLQQSWMAAIKSIHRLDEPRAIRTWLYRIARNLAISQLRKRGKAAQLLDPADLHDVPDKPDHEQDNDDDMAGAGVRR